MQILFALIVTYLCLCYGNPQLVNKVLEIGKKIICSKCITYIVFLVGDACSLKDGTDGKCSIDVNCSYVKDLLKQNKISEIVSCGKKTFSNLKRKANQQKSKHFVGFSGRNQKVCCKTSRFSERFSTGVLCEGKTEQAPIKPFR